MTTIRAARQSDAESMGRIFHAAAMAGWSGFLPVEELAARKPDGTPYVQAIRALETTVFVAENTDGEVVGFAITRQSLDADAARGTAELHMFYVHPDHWGQGAARHLMAEVLRSFQEQGYREATLWTALDNHRPRAFYRTSGWSLDGRRRSTTRYGVTFTELRHRIHCVA
ncbi:GNAT family N-acetyltransferase [Nocardiopsis ansamitocini]|uniref:N-acetyltransferase n=1 Tax=Nocardiopsis ansamitocini TaxID=1670832 RepID=A0A9W6P5G2_9ACTN|nr:GNAT family N-acetyltransferase [Nocardiopsis ansamitocini]GLU47744.1 N-acetyltransferase [Nocardiopsis ansamitocini]